jgi:hypothetical protein
MTPTSKVPAARDEAYLEKNRLAAAKWRAANPERAREVRRLSARRRYPDKRSDVQASNAKWAAANPEAVRVRKRVWKSGKMASDASFRLGELLRSGVRKAVKQGWRSGSAVRDLGCSIEDLKVHIESLFEPGMSWENWGSGDGEWSIDHIFPLAETDLTDRTQFLAAANWRNLRPMWHGDNIRKSDDVTPESRERFEVLANFTDVLPSLKGTA